MGGGIAKRSSELMAKGGANGGCNLNLELVCDGPVAVR
jgi:hypothetical protein